MSADTAPAASPSGFTRLPDHGLLRLEGERAREFLHGQATCDLLEAERRQKQIQFQHAAPSGACRMKRRRTDSKHYRRHQTKPSRRDGGSSGR